MLLSLLGFILNLCISDAKSGRKAGDWSAVGFGQREEQEDELGREEDGPLHASYHYNLASPPRPSWSLQLVL